MPVSRFLSESARSGEFASALCSLYKDKGVQASRAAVIAWAWSGELFLAHVMNGLPIDIMRSEQAAAREAHGWIVLDCKDYDRLYTGMAGSADAVGVTMHLPDEMGALHETWVDRELILEMFDFCRDGIG